eukprot:6692425-Prymnesium_polylepis.1
MLESVLACGGSHVTKVLDSGRTQVQVFEEASIDRRTRPKQSSSGPRVDSLRVGPTEQARGHEGRAPASCLSRHRARARRGVVLRRGSETPWRTG